MSNRLIHNHIFIFNGNPFPGASLERSRIQINLRTEATREYFKIFDLLIDSFQSEILGAQKGRKKKPHNGQNETGSAFAEDLCILK